MIIERGRHAVRIEGDFVVFLIGIRLNRLRDVRAWLPLVRAMPRMLAELDRQCLGQPRGRISAKVSDQGTKSDLAVRASGRLDRAVSAATIGVRLRDPSRRLSGPRGIAVGVQGKRARQGEHDLASTVHGETFDHPRAHPRK